MKAIIMAGGQGTRLRPLTCDLPKPLVPILNKPCMEYSIELLRAHGITEIGVTTYYLPEMIRDYFGDGSKWGVNLTYFVEEEPLGTAGSVRNATEFLDETFLVISGDALTDIDLSAALEYHRQKAGLATLVLSHQEVPLDFGVVITDQDGQIERFLEKPSWGEVFSDLVNTGIYILEPEVFDYYDRGIKYDFSKDLFPLLMQTGQRLYGFESLAYWSDIGDAEQYMQTQFDILAGKVAVEIAGQEVEPGIWLGQNTTILPDVKLTAPIYIGKDVQIKSGTDLLGVIIGDRTIIEAGSSLKKSILWSGVYVGSNVELRAGFLCDGVKVKNNSRIFEGAILSKETIIGRHVTIQPNIKVWPRKIVEDYTNLDRNLVWALKWRKRLFNTYGVHGLANIEMTPEFVAKLAAAYGSSFPMGVEIVVSSDNYAISRMLQKSIVAGLLSAGMKVVDLGEIPSPVTRYSVGVMEAEGGMHVRLCYDDPEEVIIEFIDRHGLMIERSMERKIEQKFFSEDFQRAEKEDVGEYFFAPQMSDSYLHGLISLLDRDQIRRQRFQLVLDYEFDSLNQILPVLLDRLGCNVESTYNYGQGKQPLSYAARLTMAKRIGDMVIDKNASLGVIIDHNGENLTLISETGRIVSDEERQILLAMTLLEQEIDKLVLPINAPTYIADLAAQSGVEVFFTRSDRPTVMQNFYQQIGVIGEPFFYPYGDGVVALALILDFLAKQNMGLEALIQSIPQFYTSLENVDCHWEEKGKIMRKLIENIKQDDVELVDGVRVHHDHGWTLIYPDGDEPVFHVYTEADNPEIAAEISREYVHMIEDCQMS